MLIALDAGVRLASSSGTREIALADFYLNDGAEHTVRQADEVLVAVTIPPARARTVFAKMAQRVGLDFATATIAGAVTGDDAQPDSVRLVMGSVAPMPVMLHQSAAILLESGLTDAGIEAAALAGRQDLGEVTNLYTPSGYKRRLIRALIRQALERLRAQ